MSSELKLTDEITFSVRLNKSEGNAVELSLQNIGFEKDHGIIICNALEMLYLWS